MSATTTTPAGPRDIWVLVVEDHSALRTGLRRLLENEPGFECVGALSHADGLPTAMGESHPDGTPVEDIAMTLAPPVDEVRRRALRIIGRLQDGNGGAGTASATVGSTSERDGS